MKRSVLGIAAAVVLAGCPSVDDVAREPARWSGTFPVAWDEMANCIARSASRDYRVTPLLTARRRTAEVILAAKEVDAVQFVFEVRGLDGNLSEVALRQRKLIADIETGDRKQWAAAERCGRRA